MKMRWLNTEFIFVALIKQENSVNINYLHLGKATCKAKGERSKYQVYSCFERSLHCFGSRLSLLITGSEHMMAVGQWDSSELTYR